MMPQLQDGVIAMESEGDAKGNIYGDSKIIIVRGASAVYCEQSWARRTKQMN